MNLMGYFGVTESGGSGMKVSYNRESDVLLIQVSEAKVDYAEEMGPIIVHFTKDGKPVLLEILDASEVISEVPKLG
jgi:uncharacterized protein YuzE